MYGLPSTGFFGMTPLTPVDDSTTKPTAPRYARLISLRCQVPQRFSRKRWKVLGCLSWAAPTGPEQQGCLGEDTARVVAGVFFLRGASFIAVSLWGNVLYYNRGQGMIKDHDETSKWISFAARFFWFLPGTRWEKCLEWKGDRKMLWHPVRANHPLSGA